MTEEQKSRMLDLIRELNQASDAYYNGQSEIMSNFEWDAKFDELQVLEKEVGEVFSDSPTSKVSEDSIDGEKVEHEFPALSLAKTKSISKFVSWAGFRNVWLSVKLDGCTLVATYDNGKLTKLVTRGNGKVGTNITFLAPAIGNLKRTIKEKGHMVIRGEAVMSYDQFLKVNAVSEESYANPRNLVTGTLALKSVEEVASRGIRWIPFTLVYTERSIPSWGDRMAYLKQLGFEVVWHDCYNHATLEQGVAEFTTMIEENWYPYPADGLVEVYDDTEFAATGSVTGHHATRAGFALKWEDEVASTELVDIEWSCAASCLTPVGIFKSVQLEGTTVKRASLVNISECNRLGMGGPGTKISVIKANKIIPKIVGVTEKVGDLPIPETCPCCGAKTKVHCSESGTLVLQCENPHCPAKQLAQFTRFVSQDGMNIEGLSKETIWVLIEMGWIRTWRDFYHLSDYADHMKELPGFGQRSVDKLMTAIESSRDVDAMHLLYALSIPMVGHDVTQRLLSRYSFSELVKDVIAAANEEDYARYVKIEQIGPGKSEAFVRWFMDDENLKNLMDLLAEVQVKEVEKSEPKVGVASMMGLTFVVTGSLQYYVNRKALQKYIESQGGKVTGSVTKNTDFLINNDVDSTSSKNKKAKELGVPIISEKQFVQEFDFRRAVHAGI